VRRSQTADYDALGIFNTTQHEMQNITIGNNYRGLGNSDYDATEQKSLQKTARA